jgi:acyl-CoA reductase-like NAD-dependent aldehyde dehydrogenase
VDGSVYVTRPTEPLDAVLARLALARRQQKAWARRPLAERIDLVREGIARLDRVNADVVTELAWQMGRPVRYGGEMGGVRERTDYMAGIAETSLAPVMIEDSDRFRRYLAREPLGLVYVVAPWNYPYLTAINTIVPALIAGNAVVLKHASQTPLAGERLAAAFANLPEGLFTNLFISHEVSSGLLRERAFDFVNFTGSVRGGQEIERAAAGTFVGVGLELGGKDPAYVRADADLGAAVATLVDGAIYNSGQCCCGIERVYVHDSLYDDFVDKSVAWVNALKLGNPFDADTTLGPMAHARFAKTVRDQTAEAIVAGAKPLIEKQNYPADDGGAYLMPQVLVNVSHDMRVMREESFGPVVGIMRVSSDDEALRLMNDSPYGLTASTWSQDAERAARLGRQIDTGTVFMTRADYVDPAVCWTGCKDTGRGGAMSVLGYRAVTRPRSYHFRKVKA